MRFALTGCLMLALVGPALADSGACVEPLEVTQQWVGGELMVSVVFELLSAGYVDADGRRATGRAYVCPMLPLGISWHRVSLRRQVPPRLGLADPPIDSCWGFIDEGTHPGDKFSRVFVWDDAGSYRCVLGPDERGEWHMQESRSSVVRVTWYGRP